MLLRAAGTLVTTILVLAAAVALAGRACGVRGLVEHSDSMYPAIATGDMVVSREIHVGDLKVGDVVTFPDLTRGGELVTHRVRAIKRVGDLVAVETRGDANTGSEEWVSRYDATVGRTIATVPHVGWALDLLGRPAVAAGLNGLLVALLAWMVAGRRRRRGTGPGRAARAAVAHTGGPGRIGA